MVGICSKLFLNSFEIFTLRAVSFLGDGIVPVILVLSLVGYFIFKKKYLEAIVFATAPLFGNLVKFLLKNYFQIPRPAEFGCEVLGSYGDIYSFPSGHTIFATIFLGLLAYLLLNEKKKYKAAALCVIIILTGVSRYLLGAHWVLDVIGGYVVGLTILTVSILLYSYFNKRNHQITKEIQGVDRRNDYRRYDEKGNILKAGSVILKGENVLILYRASHEDYTLPKGHVEKNESLETALTREILEETGLKVSIIKPLPDFFYEYHQGDGRVCVKMYLTKPSGGKLRPEHKGDKLLWLPKEEVHKKLSFDGLKEYMLKNMNEFKDV